MEKVFVRNKSEIEKAGANRLIFNFLTIQMSDDLVGKK